MKNEAELHAYNQISLFSATLSLILALLFYLSRFGLSEKYLYALFGFTGLSLVVFLLPVFVRKALVNKAGFKNFFLNDTILPLYFLLLFSLMGSIIEFKSSFISAILIFFGGSLYLIVAFYFIKETKFYIVIISTVMTTIFGIYLGSIYWTLLADPLFVENIAQGKNHIDPLFHASIAQMIKTHGIPSTGIDSIPFIKYHFGSHYLIGKLSGFLNISVLEFYHFGYLIIFLPLLMRSMLSFMIALQSDYLKLTEFKLNFLFWVLLFAPFIGFMSFDGNSIALKSGIGVQTIIYSESYCISFIYTFIIFSTIVAFSTVYNISAKNMYKELFIILFLFPTLVMLAGLTKISTLFLLTCCFCYLFIRLKLYKKWYFILSLIFLLVGSLIVFFFTNDTNDQEGSFYFFQFINEIIKSPWYVFLIVYYSLTIVFCCLIILQEKIYNKKNLKTAFYSYKTLPLEILLVITIAGFVPGEVIKFYQGNSHYFSEFQYWIAASFILAYLYLLVEKIKPSFKNEFKFGIIPLIIIGLYVGYKMNRNWLIFYRRGVDKNLNDRLAILKSYPAEYPVRLQLLKTIRTGDFSRMDSILTVLGADVEKTLMTSDKYNFLRKLKTLDTLSLSEKRKNLIYVKHLQNSNLAECYKIAFLYPAFTGIALYKGMPDGNCIGIEGYGYETYKKMEGINGDSIKLLGFKSFIVIDMEKYTISTPKILLKSPAE